MALSKGQAMALYLLLLSDSKLSRTVQNLKSCEVPDESTFLARLQFLVRQISNNTSLTLDPQLTQLYVDAGQGCDSTQPNNKPTLNLTATNVKASMPALTIAYGGGPCPGVDQNTGADDQTTVWTLLAGLT
jgi:hypothetical protein